jgi:large subunit ribosomal protein L7/L12
MSDEIKKEEEVSAPATSAPVAEEVKVEEKAEVKAEEKAEVKVPAKFKDIVSKIEEMSVIELHELVKVLEEKFGVSAAAVAVAGPANGAGAEAVEEKSAFAVELTAAGEQKIAVMKVVKEVLALGLKEAKDLVDGAPSVLKDGMKKEEAEELKKKIEEVGGKVTLK